MEMQMEFLIMEFLIISILKHVWGVLDLFATLSKKYSLV